MTVEERKKQIGEEFVKSDDFPALQKLADKFEYAKDGSMPFTLKNVALMGSALILLFPTLTALMRAEEDQ